MGSLSSWWWYFGRVWECWEVQPTWSWHVRLYSSVDVSLSVVMWIAPLYPSLLFPWYFSATMGCIPQTVKVNSCAFVGAHIDEVSMYVCVHMHMKNRGQLLAWFLGKPSAFFLFFLFFEIGSLIGPEFTKSARLTGHCSPGTHIFPVHKSTSLHTMPGSFLCVFRDSNSCFHSKHFPDWVISSSLHLIFLK